MNRRDELQDNGERGSADVAWVVMWCVVWSMAIGGCVAYKITDRRAESREHIACAKAGGTWTDTTPGKMSADNMGCLND